ncbi:MAG: hypothetical protein ACRDD1_11300 [Planctomycetia bacterium]
MTQRRSIRPDIPPGPPPEPWHTEPSGWRDLVLGLAAIVIGLLAGVALFVPA